MKPAPTDNKVITINGKDYPADNYVLDFLAAYGEAIGLEFSVDDGSDWKSAIAVRDSLKARSLVSYLANLLYGDVYAQQREQRFFDEGGEFARRIEKAAMAVVARCDTYRAKANKKTGDA